MIANNADRDTERRAESRGGIFDALNKAVEVFVSHNEEKFEDVMSNGLWPIADAASVDRIIVFRVWAKEKNFAGEVYRWDRLLGGTAPIDEALKILPVTTALKRWISAISDDSCVSLRRSEFLEDEAAFLSPRGVMSILIVPVFTEHEFWGVITFHDNTNERDFDRDCTALLRSAARLCANAIIRENVERKGTESFAALERSKKMTDTLNRMAETFLSSSEQTFGEMMNAGLEPVVKAARLDRLAVWRNFTKPDGLHSMQCYRWDKRSGGTTEPTKGLEDLSYAVFAPDWQELFAKGTAINSPASKLTGKKADILRSFNAVSVFIAPVHINNNFWGFVLFEDREEERCFEDDIAEMMRSAAFLCVNAVMRAEMERNEAAANERMKEALLRATAASEAKGLFLSNMSHEMRTPMNTIIGMASIGKKSSELERKDYALGKIEEASSHLLGVINDVLDMSKIEANKLELVLNDFSFERMLKRAVNAVSIRLEQKQQKFFVTVDGKIPHILNGDDQRLAQVIINLLSNAVKFTREGGTIRLNAFLSEEADGVCTIVIEVSDTGIGITDEQKKRLFHAFEQADSGTSRKFGGTGLGLAISRRIVEMMGGEINVTSEPGRGSEFRFSFRAKRANDTNAPLLDPGVNWETMKVLAVDDAQEILSYFTDIFERYGVLCDTALSGEEALEKIEKSGGYDIYFVDWKMPGMDGIELTKRIKKRSAQRKSVVIMISAFEWAIIREEAEGAGVDKFLMKPLFASDIMDCMNACLGVGGSNTEKQQKAVKGGELKGCSILLAEDVEINREILIASMESTGVEIDCAENGLEALRLLSANPQKYDLVFMDVQMPEMDGFEATRNIRKSGNTIPVIAMTANVFKEDIENCLAAGMDDHIGKPLNMDNVLEKIRKYRKR
jgi:signal transduction histidine kinase/CheY-like chemotaxis protein